MIKVYRNQNYLIILPDGQTDDIEFHVKDVSITKEGDEKYYFRTSNGRELYRAIEPADIVDENGDAYVDFDKWKNINTGDSSTFNESESNTYLSSIDTKLDSVKTFKELQYKVQTGEISGRLFLKSGRNPNITSASAPEDMWNGSSLYTGFPTIAEEFTITCTAGDVGGSVTFVYLASFTSTTYLTHTTVLTSTTTNTGITGIRCHTAFFSTVSGSGFNTGEIIMRQRTTVANVFFRIPAGRSQTYVSCATIPYNNKGYLWDLFAGVYGTTNVSAEMVMNIDDNGASPRLRRNFVVSNTYTYQDNAINDSPIVLNSTSGVIDISLRILSTTSASATTLVGGFNLLIIPNT